MTTAAVAPVGVIDQRTMSEAERRSVAKALRESWWDCYAVFTHDLVDLRALGLLPMSLYALAEDLEQAGFAEHATVVRRAASPTKPREERVNPWPLTQWRPRVHRGAGARR